MSGKFMSKLDLREARREYEILNSLVKRGEVDLNTSVRMHYVVCGCGAPGCGFITRWKKSDPWVVDLEQEKILYENWLKEHTGNNN